MWNEKQTPRDVQANPGYASSRIVKAWTTSRGHADAATRARADAKIIKWTSVLEGMLDDALEIGSRTPVQNTPAWVTLEVVTGGFATGGKVAGGPLLEHEKDQLQVLGIDEQKGGRAALNAFCLTEEGMQYLIDRVADGCYDVAVPEEGALLVVAWLAAHGLPQKARGLLQIITPFFRELRFYPTPTDTPRPSGEHVFVQSAGAVADTLGELQPNHDVVVQKEAIGVWKPLYDRLVGLFVETVEGEPPTLRRSGNGERAKPAAHAPFPVVGGWPLKRFAEGWETRARQILADIDAAAKTHAHSSPLKRPKDTFSRLRDLLLRWLENRSAMTGRDVGRIRLILAGYIDKRGVPGSDLCRATREHEAQTVRLPLFSDIARAVVPRFDALPKDQGIEDLQQVARPISESEARQWKLPTGLELPAPIVVRIEKCLADSVEALVERGLISSGEMLARLLPQITAGIRAAGIADPDLRRLYASIYRAFRRRRSLLLLNLQSQVRIEELPWVAAIDSFRQETSDTRVSAQQTLRELSLLTLGSFPQALIPNKLMKEMRTLAKTAGLDMPFVDELAADIFMGQFTGNFVKAAQTAARLLEGTLYATYYGIDYRRVAAIPDPGKPQRKGWFFSAPAKASPSFADLCFEMAGVKQGNWKPATNGMVIEQQQIITTQNLAVLFEGLNLRPALSGSLLEMAMSCFAWICRRLQMKTDKWHAKLITVKNTAYAWRQMVFFLALLTHEEQEGFVAWAREHLQKQHEPFRSRFVPALEGIERAIAGQRPGQTGDARIFLGWSTQKHWLLEG